MKYYSTNHTAPLASLHEAVVKGLAPDRGLYMPERIKKLPKEFFENIDKLSFQEIAYQVADAFFGEDVKADDLKRIVYDTLQFDCPIKEVEDNIYSLELFHGPTLAFKDVGARFMARMLQYFIREEGTKNVNVLVATSGDTGSAVANGFLGVEGIHVYVLYPKGKVSHVQNLQMSTQEGANVAVCAVRGNFDDAQTAVKQIFANKELGERLAAGGTILSSANSINVGRLVPQVVYYFAAYAQLLRAGAIQTGDAVEFCVPTGNFGDILAGYYAKRMGLPVAKLLVASDKNNVLADFLATGTYDRERPFYTTTSPSMDILVSSNLERMLYYLADGDCELVADLMSKLTDKGNYQIPAELLERIRTVFDGGWADEDQVAAAIRRCWDENGYVIDPHTACGYHVMEQTAAVEGTACRVLLSTASPYKFPKAVAEALGLFCPPDDFACMEVLAKHTGTTAPAQLTGLKTKPVRFEDVVDVADMGSYVEQAASRIAKEA